jgi:hypothetical protein
LPEFDDYWSTDPILQHPWFASITVCHTKDSSKFYNICTVLIILLKL